MFFKWIFFSRLMSRIVTNDYFLWELFIVFGRNGKKRTAQGLLASESIILADYLKLQNLRNHDVWVLAVFRWSLNVMMGNIEI